MLACAENDPRGSGTIWTLDLTAPALELAPLLPATFRFVGTEASIELAGAGGGVAADEFRKRFESGRRCCAALVAGQLAAYGWISQEEEWIGELRLRLRLSPGEAYIWDCFTLPAFRQYYLYTALLSNIVAILRSEQLRRAWIGTNTENLASQRGIARAGFQPVATIGVERAFALHMVWVKGLPGVPESQVAEARRVFLNARDRVWLEAPAAAAAYLHHR
jgi:ribosomal protein S18 acetylase RimI-like enzyme